MRIQSLFKTLLVLGLLVMVSLTSPPAASSSVECATFDPQTGILHISSVSVGDAMFWVDMRLVSPNFDPIAIAISADTETVSGNAWFDPQSKILYLPCVHIEGESYWGNLRIIRSNPMSFDIQACGVNEIPAWLQELIGDISSQPAWNPPARITRYEYNGAMVYYVPQDCCDQFNLLYDENGNVLCSPDGGITGQGDGRCPDFFSVSKSETLIWQDKRTAFTGNILKWSDFYRLEQIDMTPQVPAYALPLKQEQISNMQSFSQKMQLVLGAQALLQENGFAVMNNPLNPQEEDITKVYSQLRALRVPLFITTDSLLHLYHIQFDETLRMIEEREFYDDIWQISTRLLDHFVSQYQSGSGDPAEMARRNGAFFAVALSLLQPRPEQVCVGNPFDCNNWEAHFTQEELARYSFELPPFVKAEVEAELALIDEKKGFSVSALFNYKEDYSQYAPRGHYTRSERLKNYFKAFMWYGRMSFLLKGALIALRDADHEATLQTGQAALIASRFAEDQALKERWDRIYSVTSFYVGTSDDLGPYEYLDAIRFVFGDTFSPDDLTQAGMERLKTRLAEYRSPMIYGGTGNCVIPPPYSPDQADECLEDTKGFRFMGQRFIPDSYMFSNLVGAYTGFYQGTGAPFTLVFTEAGPIRGFPRGLDVLALLGSGRAREILDSLGDTNYERYEEAFSGLKAEFDAFTTEEWNKNLYFSWLHSLVSLLQPFPEGYPTFMRTSAWLDKEITTALASWTELRHDTILYAKQSYTGEATGYPPVPPRVVGYVEPVPEFYQRLLALTRMTNQGLSLMNVLDEAAQIRLQNLETMLSRLVEISRNELMNLALSDEDYDFINDFAFHLNGVIRDVKDEAKKTTIVADVHTDANSMKVLEEGVGYVKLMVAAYKVPDGRILLGAGPVMSYFELKHPAGSRLTDEAWREMLKTNRPENVEWYSDFGS
jgi:hypothetical protein